MEKIIPAGSWDFNIEPLAVIKTASSGLSGQDRRDLFVKRAASNVFAGVLDKLTYRADEVPIHAIAIGATEGWGFNRNGDAFKEATCRDRHHTFVSKPISMLKSGEHGGARLFKHHQHGDPNKSFGYVKASAYNDAMRRIELIIIANATKTAADRNGGLVLDDRYLQKLASGNSVPFSMACRVPLDECDICHNKAANRSQYCDDTTCIADDGFHGFGCKTGLTKIASNGRAQYVENPNCSFFDFSIVGHPADRTAYGMTADYLTKAAHAAFVIGGAELAEKYAEDNGLSQHDADPTINRAMQLLVKLAAIEQELINSSTAADRATSRAFVHETALVWPFLGTPGSSQYYAGIKAAAAKQLSFTVSDFLQVTGQLSIQHDKHAECVEAITECLPGMYGRLLVDIDTPRRLKEAGLLKLAAARPSSLQLLGAEKYASARALTPSSLQDRARLSAIRDGRVGLQQDLMTKSASSRPANDPAEALAIQYALTKLAMLCFCPDTPEFPLTLRAAVLENHSC